MELLQTVGLWFVRMINMGLALVGLVLVCHAFNELFNAVSPPRKK